jgi:hypothetical protein
MSKEERPNCVRCGKQFNDEDVATENFYVVGMSMERGPSLCHKKCPSVRRGIYQ